MSDEPEIGDERGLPRWLKVSVVVALLLALLVVIAMLVSGGGHGPGRHFGAGANPGAFSSSDR
jgi:hypothetical protein